MPTPYPHRHRSPILLGYLILAASIFMPRTYGRDHNKQRQWYVMSPLRHNFIHLRRSSTAAPHIPSRYCLRLHCRRDGGWEHVPERTAIQIHRPRCVFHPGRNTIAQGDCSLPASTTNDDSDDDSVTGNRKTPHHGGMTSICSATTLRQFCHLGIKPMTRCSTCPLASGILPSRSWHKYCSLSTPSPDLANTALNLLTSSISLPSHPVSSSSLPRASGFPFWSTQFWKWRPRPRFANASLQYSSFPWVLQQLLMGHCQPEDGIPSVEIGFRPTLPCSPHPQGYGILPLTPWIELQFDVKLVTCIFRSFTTSHDVDSQSKTSISMPVICPDDLCRLYFSVGMYVLHHNRCNLDSCFTFVT